MELLSALLTGFFFWLWQFNSWRNRRARARETAGALLLQVNAARRIILANRWMRIIVSLIVLGAVVMRRKIGLVDLLNVLRDRELGSDDQRAF